MSFSKLCDVRVALKFANNTCSADERNLCFVNSPVQGLMALSATKEYFLQLNDSDLVNKPVTYTNMGCPPIIIRLLCRLMPTRNLFILGLAEPGFLVLFWDHRVCIQTVLPMRS